MEFFSRLWQYIEVIMNIVINTDKLRFSTFFSDPDNIWAALFIGILWGFVLQKTTICKYDVVYKFLTLQDLTVHKVGVPLVISAMIMIHFLYNFGIIDNLVVPPTIIAGQIIGGLILGSGAAIAGYCPGTSAGALGEGSLDALPFMLGMLVGSELFAETYPFFNDTILSIGNLGSVTFPELLGYNHWFIIIPLTLAAIIMEITIFFGEKKILKTIRTFYAWLLKVKC